MLQTPQWRDVLEQKISQELKPVCAFCSESADQAAEVYNLQKITLLREISLKTGVQVRSMSSLPFPSSAVLRNTKVRMTLWGQTARAPGGLCGVKVGIQVPALGKEISNPVPFSGELAVHLPWRISLPKQFL